MSGVTLNLKQAKEGETFTLTVAEDTPKMISKVKTLIEQVNGVLEFINKQNQVGKESDTRSTFAGDVMLQNLEYRFRNVMHEGFPVWGMTPENTDEPIYMHLHDLGIEMDKKGQISIKEDKLQKALEKNPEIIGAAISGEFGLANQLKNIIGGYVDPQRGTLKIKENAIQANIKRMDDQIAQKEKNLSIQNGANSKSI
jgi:flagellar hook-associated protein 2